MGFFADGHPESLVYGIICIFLVISVTDRESDMNKNDESIITLFEALRRTIMKLKFVKNEEKVVAKRNEPHAFPTPSVPISLTFHTPTRAGPVLTGLGLV